MAGVRIDRRRLSDVVTSPGSAPAFEQPGAKAGDLFDLTGLGDLSWGGTGRGAITMKAVGSDTFCYVNTDSDSVPEFEICIVDGAVSAIAYTQSDFFFL